jgi:integrase
MPRTVREVNLSTREARGRLKARKKPYYRSLAAGLHLGYRKSASGAAWVVRWYAGEGVYRLKNLKGRPDDAPGDSPDNETVLNWTQAEREARKVASRKQREALGIEEVTGPYTVSDALRDYVGAYERKGGRATDRIQAIVNAHIEPALGAVDLSRLHRSQVEAWFHALAEQGQRVRVGKGKAAKHRAAPKTEDEKRRRRATANRCLTVLKAALNHAHHVRKVASNDAWASVRPFRHVDTPVIRYLSDAEAARLVNACDQEFRPLVQAALLTGCRYGELTALQVRDFNADAGTVAIRVSKSGKPRHVVLTEEGQRFFAQVTAGKDAGALVFTRKSGAAWGKSHQQKPLTTACKAAKIKPAVRFHDLRHTHGSALAMKGVPLVVIAAQLGHADTRMTERHYAHLSPSYVADTIRASFPVLGIVPKSNVRAITGKP